MRKSGAAVLEEETTSHGGTESGWRTLLFNCECHSFDQVESQLLKAIRCSLSRARAISWEVHTKGSAVVYEGARERAEAVAAVLGDIGLIVKVAQ
ncbi:MAG: ATP-dependent Clp protease adaptor ClpS [Elusimicrobia bacterium]|nr:ATP-dependent Clp protease adaptor ClpS [Elusimicrobiota bacterium]